MIADQELFKIFFKQLLTFLFVCDIIYLKKYLNSKERGIMGLEETFKAMSDPVRREILSALKNGKLSAGEISSKFDMTGAAISYHLNILKKADLISESRYKNFIYYRLNTTVLDDVILWIKGLEENTAADLAASTDTSTKKMELSK